MVYYADKSYDIPPIDLLTLLFDSPETLAKEDTILHAEAANPSNSITKAQARVLTKRVAHGLRQNYGVGKNGPGKDVVIGISSGQVLLPILFYGVICCGGVYSAASTSATTPELVRQVKQGGANLIACSLDTKDVAVAAAKECGIPLSRVLLLQSAPRSLQSIQGNINAISDQELDWTRITDPQELENSVICLLYSSGTTGIPKAVLLSHSNTVSEALIPQYMFRSYISAHPEEPPFSYRTLAHLPAAHIAGCQGYFVNPVVAGGPVNWMPRFDFPLFLAYNQKYQITSFFTVPPIYLLIAKSPLVKDQFKPHLRTAISGAAPMGKELQELASRKLGVSISQTWGLSETTGSVTVMPWGQSDFTGSVSPLMPNISMRIVDEADRDVEEGQPGELLIKGPVVSKGYFRNEAATREAFTADGWFRTGDIGLRRDARFYVVDRKKELIKYKGLQVAPAELEALLLSHPLIADAAVIGVPDPDGSGNELPRAYVVAVEKPKITEQEVKEFVKKNAAAYKQLRGGVVWVQAVPKTASWKILRKDLREMARRERVEGRGTRL